MTLETILAIFLFRYLQKSLKSGESKLRWNKILTAGLVVSVGLLVVQVTIQHSSWLTDWFVNAIMLILVFLVYKQEDFVTENQLCMLCCHTYY